MTIGPSMANLVQYYGHRKAYGLSVSPNPLNRNPSYEPLVNPDRAIRDNELQYVVWDTFSASRSPNFSSSLLRYARPLQRPGRPHRDAPGQRRPRRERRAGRRSSSSRCGREPRLARALALVAGVARVRRRRPRRPSQRRRSEHFVVLMQENHSFDNYFGTYPGGGRHPGGDLHAGRAHGAPALRPAVPPRRPARLPTSLTTARMHRSSTPRADGRLRPGGLGRTARRSERSVMGYYDDARPAVLLERRRRVRPLRPLLRRRGRGSVPATCSG